MKSPARTQRPAWWRNQAPPNHRRAPSASGLAAGAEGGARSASPDAMAMVVITIGAAPFHAGIDHRIVTRHPGVGSPRSRGNSDQALRPFLVTIAH